MPPAVFRACGAFETAMAHGWRAVRRIRKRAVRRIRKREQQNEPLVGRELLQKRS